MQPASAARDRQSQSNLFRPDLFCLSVSICNLKEKMFALCASQIVIFLVRFADFASGTMFARGTVLGVRLPRYDSDPHPGSEISCSE